jgi:3-oxosteroid 1-dehydrogenase
MSQIFDVVVLGSGAAAATTALRISQRGLRVLVVEKSEYLGGTSAMSGAGTWVPANHVAAAAGIEDSVSEALTYLRATAPEGWEGSEDDLWQAYADASPRMLQFVVQTTPLRFKLVAEPDPFSEKAGGKSFGRMLTPKPLSRSLLGSLKTKLRRSTLVHLFDYEEMVRLDPYHHPVRATLTVLHKLIWRLMSSSGGQGTALMVGLIKGCVDQGTTFWSNARARRLVQDESGRVTGVVVEQQGAETTVRARYAVVIATGGFEWNSAMLSTNFPGEISYLGSPSSNEGDGQIMVAEIGASLERMNQANIYPCLPTVYEGRRYGLPMTFQAERHSIVVNGRGKRFVSENDFNIGEALDRRDPETGRPINLPVWLIADHRFLSQSLPFRWYASYEKGWITKAGSIHTLAEKIGVPSQQLAETVERFNAFCRNGRDEDFGRGESAWEGYKSHSSKVALYTIEKPPFVAIPINRSILGTKGGARTNRFGQVLHSDGTVIAGLFAAGLAMANPIGTRAVGAGTTIGPNMTWGFICAEQILREAGYEN